MYGLNLHQTKVGKGFEFENAIVGGSVPKEYINPVINGLKDALRNGVLAGFPVVDVKAKLYDGSYHDVDSDEISFKVAASMAFKQGALKGGPILLEPMMSVEVITPEEYLGDVMGDINSRRGKIEGFNSRKDAQVIQSNGTSCSNVWICNCVAFHDTRSCNLFDAVFALLRST